MATLITIIERVKTPLQCQESQVIKAGILTICIVKYDMLLHDMMEFLRLMSDGLVDTGTTKFITYLHQGLIAQTSRKK